MESSTDGSSSTGPLNPCSLDHFHPSCHHPFAAVASWLLAACVVATTKQVWLCTVGETLHQWRLHASDSTGLTYFQLLKSILLGTGLSLLFFDGHWVWLHVYKKMVGLVTV